MEDNKTFNNWICDKCNKELPRDELTELFGWGLYACEDCILKWIVEKEE
jgi:hypothetical protein